jgi:hypothetical protein
MITKINITHYAFVLLHYGMHYAKALNVEIKLPHA